MTRTEPFPPAPAGGELIHTRAYEVRAYKMSDDRFILRGVVRDEKPAGLYVADDPDPLWMHHMVVDLEVSFPSFQINAASVEFHEHPHLACTDIEGEYQKLVGLSIARGFNAKVKELFGGPRGCTHIGALLSAMAPVAIQSGWSMRVGSAGPSDSADGLSLEERRKRAYAMNVNTCHVWAEDGEMLRGIAAGQPMEIPLSVKRRLESLGRDGSEWMPSGF